MATTTLILEKSSAKRPADSHAVTLAAPQQKPAAPRHLSVWPAAGASVAAYRTQAHRLRAEAIAGALKWGWTWLRS